MSRLTKLSLGFLMGAALLLSGCGSTTTTYKINLEIWGVFDDSDAFLSIINDYKEINPFIGQITYRKLSPETYRDDLLNALASGKAPDIFLIQNTWVESFRDKTIPAPDSLLLEKDFRAALVDVAADDLISSDHKIYGMPLSVDSLALYYNKDLLNAAGITQPPATWEDLLKLVPRLKKMDNFGNITQSAVALGTAYNINRSSDILLTLGAQLGSSVNPRGFDDEGMRKAFDFYTKFALSGSPYYTWNRLLHNSLDAFSEGNTAMMLNYSWQYSSLKQKNPKLNFAVASLPQFTNMKPVNFANYWTFVVTANKATPDPKVVSGISFPADKYQDLRRFEAWQFLKYLGMPHPSKTWTTQNILSGNTKDFPMKSDPGLSYLRSTNQPAARRDLIEGQKNDVVLSPFALGNLIARSWKPANPEAAETVIAEAVDSVNRGERTILDALSVITSRLVRQFSN